MLVIRATKKLRDKLKASPSGSEIVSTNLLGDWYANSLPWRPQTAILVNAKTFVPVLLPLAPARTLLDRAPGAIAQALSRYGIPLVLVEREVELMNPVTIAPTADRVVVGVMNEFITMADYTRATYSDVESLNDTSDWLASSPVGPLRKTYNHPDLAVIAAFGLEPPTATRRRRRPATST
jgi:hypothetical protein